MQLDEQDWIMTAADSPMDQLVALAAHQQALRACRACPDMHGPPVVGNAVPSSVLLMGQAPGARERELGRPFAWTAGKTLFGWFETIGLAERDFRDLVYMSAVCRCFPGKAAKGGDRVPSRPEIEHCRRWWEAELALLRPGLIIPVGRLAIARFTDAKRLQDVVGRCWEIGLADDWTADLVPLPHPSGASTWFKTEPGRTLLERALALIGSHPGWRELVRA
jgi:uracil-DNA glycosylase